ncbi:hypothetical protein U9M48_031040 [Paspalum notatum var. saurae]|uniref:Uncharacterized protein n=1 Tax=Paspalum notatum var. saurae TaxID=547442 RepID=A0AAQ3X3X2_PASNO
MSITVTKSSAVIVAPSTSPATTAPPPVQQHLKLSSFDKALAFSPFTSFLVFDHAIPEPAETVRKALSRALVPYFALAGRLTRGPGGDGDELHISCTGEGVSFVSASASCSLDDVKLFDQPFAALLRELAVDYPEESCRPSDPLVLMQVTEFSCGGYVVGTTWNHAVADGTGIAQFLGAVGDFARGLPQPCVFPVSCGDDSLPELPPLATFIEKTMVSLEPQGFVYQDITVPWKVIDRIRSEFASGDDSCTVYEAVVAVLWQCRTRVVMSDPDAAAPLVFAANVRGLVGARSGYFGNCITSAVIVPRCGEVASGGIGDVVKLIKRAKKGIPDQFRGVAIDGGGDSVQRDDALFGYNAFYVSSWRNLGFDVADMGGGRPARVMCHVELTAVPNCMACLPCTGKDGANVLALCVREEHVGDFLGELDKWA